MATMQDLADALRAKAQTEQSEAFTQLQIQVGDLIRAAAGMGGSGTVNVELAFRVLLAAGVAWPQEGVLNSGWVRENIYTMQDADLQRRADYWQDQILANPDLQTVIDLLNA